MVGGEIGPIGRSIPGENEVGRRVGRLVGGRCRDRTEKWRDGRQNYRTTETELLYRTTELQNYRTTELQNNRTIELQNYRNGEGRTIENRTTERQNNRTIE
jgi:hypothetical protein